MKDFFHNYHKHRVLQHAGILALSLVMALGLNMFLLSGNTGKMIKANILEAGETLQKNTDIYPQIHTSFIELKNSQSMKGVNELSLALAYNPKLKFSQIITPLDMHTEIIHTTPGLTTLILTSENPQNIPKHASLIHIYFEATQESGTNIINIINANFTDTASETYELSTESVIF